MKIKVCGLKKKENIAQLELDKIDMLGFIFYNKSPRYLGPGERSILADIEHSKVGVFVNEDMNQVIEIAQQCQLDYVQLHGSESPAYCDQIAQIIPYFKAFSVDNNFDFDQIEEYNSAELLVLDAKGDSYGGNGVKYDWNLIEKYKGKTPFLVSGGIGPDDVEAIKSFNHPSFAGIDINSGFEIKPGLKDTNLVNKFTKQIR